MSEVADAVDVPARDGGERHGTERPILFSLVG